MNHENISIRHNAQGLFITATTDADARKSQPRIPQTKAEKIVLEIHQKVKDVTSYKETSFSLEDCDYYDEGYDHYPVAGASIAKGQRSVKDKSWSKTSIPKAWEIVVHIAFGPVQKVSKPLSLSLEALGVSVDVNKVQAILKKKGSVEITGEWKSGSGYFSSSSLSHTIAE